MKRPCLIAVVVLACVSARSIGAPVPARDAAAAAAQPPVDVRSPDGQVVISLRIDGANRRPVYRVTYKGGVVVDDSPLGVTFPDDKGGRFDSFLSLDGVERDSRDETYPLVAGKGATARNHYNEATARLIRGGECASGQVVRVTLRAYDDGAALRYAFAKPGDP